MFTFKSIFIKTILCMALAACASTRSKDYSNITLKNLIEKNQITSNDKTRLLTSTIERAESDLNAGRIKSALKHANLALRFEPTDLRAKKVVGKAEIANGNYTAGSTHFANLIQTDPSAENFQFFGISHYFLGDKKTAKLALLKAVEINPKLWRSSALLARIENRNQAYTEADRLFASAMSYAPFSETIYEHMGQAYIERKDWSQALTAFQNAQLSSNNSVGLHDQYRLAMAKTGQLNAVLRSSRSDEIARLYRSLGEESLQNGDKFAAIKYLKKAKAHFSHHDERTSNLLQSVINSTS